MDCSRDDIIRGLTEINVIVRMDGLRAALTSKDFARPVRDDLVGVHVRRSSGTRLKDIDNEMLVETTFRHFLRRSLDGLGDAWFEQPQIGVDAGGSEFDQAEGSNERPAQAQRAGREVLRS